MVTGSGIDDMESINFVAVRFGNSPTVKTEHKYLTVD